MERQDIIFEALTRSYPGQPEAKLRASAAKVNAEWMKLKRRAESGEHGRWTMAEQLAYEFQTTFGPGEHEADSAAHKIIISLGQGMALR